MHRAPPICHGEEGRIIPHAIKICVFFSLPHCAVRTWFPRTKDDNNNKICAKSRYLLRLASKFTIFIVYIVSLRRRWLDGCLLDFRIYSCVFFVKWHHKSFSRIFFSVLKSDKYTSHSHAHSLIRCQEARNEERTAIKLKWTRWKEREKTDEKMWETSATTMAHSHYIRENENNGSK